jgi:hypothetical protein
MDAEALSSVVRRPERQAELSTHTDYSSFRVGRGTILQAGESPVRFLMRPLGRPRRRWVDNIKMDLGEMTASVV